MGLGVCRHCNASGIPVDAPVCRYCVGWRPNPGLMTQLGVTIRRAFALLLFVIGVALVGLGAMKDLMAAWFGFFVFLLPGSGLLFRALFRPYGKPPADY